MSIADHFDMRPVDGGLISHREVEMRFYLGLRPTLEEVWDGYVKTIYGMINAAANSYERTGTKDIVDCLRQRLPATDKKLRCLGLSCYIKYGNFTNTLYAHQIP